MSKYYNYFFLLKGIELWNFVNIIVWLCVGRLVVFCIYFVMLFNIGLVFILGFGFEEFLNGLVKLDFLIVYKWVIIIN